MCTQGIKKIFWSRSIKEKLRPIIVVDFGGQVTQKIVKILRKNRIYCVSLAHTVAIKKLEEHQPLGIILSGGPASVMGEESPQGDRGILSLGVPILGICYGMQLLCIWDGGTVIHQDGDGEYGRTEIFIEGPGFLEKLEKTVLQVWMSHRDKLGKLPDTYKVVARSTGCIAAMQHKVKHWYGVQFHPELTHTECGEQILINFALDICKSLPRWIPFCITEKISQEVREKVGLKTVVLALSGGVDSTALAFFLEKILGERLTCIVVDTGLLRKGEITQIKRMLQAAEVRFSWKVVDAKDYFLQQLQGVISPEEKRKVVGRCFVERFFEEIKGFDMLAQGTIYSDVIESGDATKVNKGIKTHHNRVEQIMELERNGRLLEPFQTLFKDEVREIAAQVGVPRDFIDRQPFPGPGLAVRILGEVSKEKVAILQEVDQIVREELVKVNPIPWQYFAVLTDSISVGVVGDMRKTGYVVAIRAIDSVDGMSARWARVPYEVLERCSSRICNENEKVSRVVYDITHKPPATIEWE